MPVRQQAPKAPGSAPSIPGRFDQFGYDETSDGHLRRQVAPNRGHLGRDGDTVGPGEYELQQAITKAVRGGADFSRSASTRPENRHPGDAAHIGPGYYDVTGEGNAKFVVVAAF